jgi:hypothetical protein
MGGEARQHGPVRGILMKATDSVADSGQRFTGDPPARRGASTRLRGRSGVGNEGSKGSLLLFVCHGAAKNQSLSLLHRSFAAIVTF